MLNVIISDILKRNVVLRYRWKQVDKRYSNTTGCQNIILREFCFLGYNVM
jgi:hypothetical protein